MDNGRAVCAHGGPASQRPGAGQTSVYSATNHRLINYEKMNNKYSEIVRNDSCLYSLNESFAWELSESIFIRKWVILPFMILIVEIHCSADWIYFWEKRKNKKFEKFENHKVYRMLSRRRILKFHQCWRFKSSSPIIPKDHFVKFIFAI